MNTFKKILMVPLLILFGILAASVYGALHDQISFTVSPEYFTRFKFEQFHMIPRVGAQRVGAAMVGVLATWWMGLIIGLILALVALIQRDASTMFKSTLQSYGLVVVVALVTGLVGLTYGIIHLSRLPLSEFKDWYIPDNLQNAGAYISVGSMHNFSYLGGVIGMFVGVWWQIHFKRRITTEASQQTVGGEKEDAYRGT